MVMGIGRGDSARRVIGHKPVKMAEFERSLVMMKDLMNGRKVHWNEQGARADRGRSRTRRSRCRSPATGRRRSPSRAASATASSSSSPTRRSSSGSWTRRARRPRRPAATRPRSSATSCAPSHISDDIADAREQVRWFPAMVSNHVMDLVERYGFDSEIPEALTEYVKARKFYDYKDHSRVGAAHGEFVTDEICDRFCVLGTPEQAIAKLRELESVGVDHFNIYLMTHGPGGDAEGVRRPHPPRVLARHRVSGVALAPRPARGPWALPADLSADGETRARAVEPRPARCSSTGRRGRAASSSS